MIYEEKDASEPLIVRLGIRGCFWRPKTPTLFTTKVAVLQRCSDLSHSVSTCGSVLLLICPKAAMFYFILDIQVSGFTL